GAAADSRADTPMADRNRSPRAAFMAAIIRQSATELRPGRDILGHLEPMRRPLVASILLGAAWAAATATAADGERLRYTDAAGHTVVELKPHASGVHLRDASGGVLGEVKVHEDRVKLKDANDVEIRKIKRKADGAEIE